MHETLRGFYTKLYTSEKHDSPEKSRVSLTQRIKRTLSAGIPRNEVLNIGSGPQSLERQLWKMGDTSLFSRFRFSTVDVATISPKKLLGRNNPNITHTQASALNLPYGDETFGLIVSNHAIDFLPRNSFNEAYRVLAPNGKAIFYFHHPDMIPNDLDRVRNITVKMMSVSTPVKMEGDSILLTLSNKDLSQNLINRSFHFSKDSSISLCK